MARISQTWKHGNFSTLVNKLYDKFERSHSLDKQTSDLYSVVQGPTESAREMIGIKDLNSKNTIN